MSQEADMRRGDEKKKSQKTEIVSAVAAAPKVNMPIPAIPQADHVMEIDNGEESNFHNSATCSSEKADMRSGDEKKNSFGALTGIVLENDSEKKKRKDIRALYAAALKGNWQDAKALVKKDSTLLYSKLTPGGDTVLHIATSANHSAFVKKLVDLGKVDNDFSIDLALRNKNGDTAFSIAAVSGFVDIARIMKKEKDELSNLTSHEETPKENDELPNPIKETPLFKAVHGGHKKMARYLFPLTDICRLDDADRNKLFVATATNEMYDISLVMLRSYPKLAYAWDPKSNLTALHVLAQKSQGTASGSGQSYDGLCSGTTITYIYSWIYGKAFVPTSAYQLLEQIWNKVLTLDDDEILELIREKPRVLFEAVKSGNVEFVTLLVKSFPYLIWEEDEDGKRFFDVAISHRNEKIFNLCVSIGAFTDTSHTTHIDNEGNNMLHLAANLSPLADNDISRPNLQMQREISWFKEVEKIVSPAYINMKNKKGLTPKDVFLKEHKDLMIIARNAMKETASSCMVVSTLISTIVFAAALTEPGSTYKTTCTCGPNFSNTTCYCESDSNIKNVGFTVFVASNVVALFSSTTSTIMLLSILTSLFVESDYIKSLRANMRWALNALFISIISLVIAFSAAVFSICDKNSYWITYFTALFAPVPVILFISLYFKLGMGRI